MKSADTEAMCENRKRLYSEHTFNLNKTLTWAIFRSSYTLESNPLHIWCKKLVLGCPQYDTCAVKHNSC